MSNLGNRPESTHAQLLVAWKYKGYKKVRVFIHLIECDEQIDWNEIKLRICCQRCVNQLSTYTDLTKETWLLHDGTVLMTRLELYLIQDGVVCVVISDSFRDNRIKKSVWISSKR
jgi:hypothetical protein